MESAFCKMRENKRLRLVGGGSRSHGKPGPHVGNVDWISSDKSRYKRYFNRQILRK